MSDGGAQYAVKALEALDNHNVPLAETTVEAGLKKFPGHAGIRAAQAYCFLKLGFTSEAVARAVALSQEDIRDPTTFNAITHVLQSTCTWDPLAATYEKAIAVLGETKQALENLFQTYVRKGDYPKAQRVAATLAKKHPSPQYQVWTVMANLGQVPPDSTDHLLLKLGARMLDTVILSEGGIRKTETVKMYVDVLLQQQQYEQAVDFLRSARGSMIGLLETRLEYMAKAYHGLKRSDVVSALGLLRWQSDSDHWEAFLQFIDNMPATTSQQLPLPSIVLDTPNAPSGAEAAPLALRSVTSYAEALTIADELSAVELSTRRAKMRRGPFLATLELLKRSAGETAELSAKVAEYCSYFASKSCCFMDVLPYVSEGALVELRKRWNTSPPVDGEDLSWHQKAMLLMSIELVVADFSKMPDEAALRLVGVCLESYKRTEALSTALAWSEEGLCDGYVTIAVNVAWRKFCHEPSESKRRRWLLVAVSCLHGRLRFMNNPTWLMLCALLYNHLGLAHTAALKQLDFKSIQHDSMPHIGYVPLETGLAIPEAARWNAHGNIYYSNLPRDIGLLRSKVFTLVSWPVMRDIGHFESRHTYSMARLENVAHHATWQIAECQTSRDLHTHLINSGPKCAAALLLLLDDLPKIRCNADQTVAQTLVLGPIGTPATKELASRLLSTPSLPERAQRTMTLLAMVVVLHDVSSVQQGLQRKASAPKPKKGEPPVTDEPAAPLLWGPFAGRSSDVFAASPLLREVADGLLGNASCDNVKPQLLGLKLNSVLLQTLLQLSAAVRVCSPKLASFSSMCSSIGAACETHLASVEDSLEPNIAPEEWDIVVEGQPAIREEIAKLRAQKITRARELLKQLHQEVTVASKRR